MKKVQAPFIANVARGTVKELFI